MSDIAKVSPDLVTRAHRAEDRSAVLTMRSRGLFKDAAWLLPFGREI
jgi:hypothetical protein